MTGNDFNIALFLFFIPYILLEVPSNLLLKHCRPSLYIGGMIFFWGGIDRVPWPNPILRWSDCLSSLDGCF